MLRQKRYLVAGIALILLISGCGLKGPLYKKHHKPKKNMIDNSFVTAPPVNNSSIKQK